MLSIDLPGVECDEGRPVANVFGCGGAGEVSVSAP